MGYWSGGKREIHWAYTDGAYSDEQWRRYVDELEGAVTHFEGGALLTIARDPRMPSPAERKDISDLIRAGKTDHVRAHAVVCNSFVARGVVTALNWVVDKPFEERVFSEPGPALEWLREHCPHVTAALWDDIAREVGDAAGAWSR